MKVFTYSHARQHLSEVLDTAVQEEVLIKRRGGETFTVVYREQQRSPFDVPGIKTAATTKDIIDAVRESRSRRAAPIERRRGKVSLESLVARIPKDYKPEEFD
jgi:hypothetical protein